MHLHPDQHNQLARFRHSDTLRRAELGRLRRDLRAVRRHRTRTG